MSLRGRDGIVVLHVDDEPAFAEMTAEFLERDDQRFSVRTATSAGDGLEYLAANHVDCIVSDYDMPNRNGIEFLEAVRERGHDLPFVLFTGKGSEEIASDAISAGVTDYLQKEGTTEQYELLANRIETAVSQHRTERELERQNDLFAKAQDIAEVGAWEYDTATETSYVTDQTKAIHGLSPAEELHPEGSIAYYHPDDRPVIREAFRRGVEHGEPYDLELRLIDDDGNRRWVRTRGHPRLEDGEYVRLRGTIQDITERKERERELERQVDRLEEFTTVVSHDLRNPLNVAQGQLEEGLADADESQLAAVAEALDRMEAIIEDTLTLARQGRTVAEKRPVSISAVVEDCWSVVESDDATLRLVDEFTVLGDRNRLLQIFENLFRNAIEHAAPSRQSQSSDDGPKYSHTSRQPLAVDVADRGRETVTVSIGLLNVMPTSTRADTDGPGGFYVEDDGPGIPAERRGSVFDPGTSWCDGGTGFGLAIVKRIAQAHGWEVTATESVDGGARFEFTGVDLVE